MKEPTDSEVQKRTSAMIDTINAMSNEMENKEAAWLTFTMRRIARLELILEKLGGSRENGNRA